jgi:putative ABC transport system permease protein
LPLAGNNTDSNFYVEGRPEPEAGAEPAAWYSSVTPDYFQTMGIRLIKGRWFGTNDTADSTKVVVISQKFVERYFPDEDPIGRRIGDQPSGPKANWREIVGVVGDVKQFGLDVDSRVTMYLPHSQQPARFMTVVVRGTGDLTTIAASVRSQIGAIDKDLGVSNIRTMEQVRDSSVAPQRFTLLLLMIFAGAAVLLAAVGIYGVISYTVAQRTPEIGLRMALGASRQDVVALVAKQGMLLTGLGVCSGLLAAFGLTRLIQTLLFGVTSTDPLTFGLIPVLLAIVALAACVIPARRAARVDPMVALRYE